MKNLMKNDPSSRILIDEYYYCAVFFIVANRWRLITFFYARKGDEGEEDVPVFLSHFQSIHAYTSLVLSNGGKFRYTCQPIIRCVESWRTVVLVLGCSNIENVFENLSTSFHIARNEKPNVRRADFHSINTNASVRWTAAARRRSTM